MKNKNIKSRFEWLDFGKEIEDKYQLKLKKEHEKYLKKLREADQKEREQIEKEAIC